MEHKRTVRRIFYEDVVVVCQVIEGANDVGSCRVTLPADLDSSKEILSVPTQGLLDVSDESIIVEESLTAPEGTHMACTLVDLCTYRLLDACRTSRLSMTLQSCLGEWKLDRSIPSHLQYSCNHSQFYD
jgi:hypothetical protein